MNFSFCLGEYYLRSVIDRIAQHPMRIIPELLPWRVSL